MVEDMDGKLKAEGWGEYIDTSESGEYLQVIFAVVKKITEKGLLEEQQACRTFP